MTQDDIEDMKYGKWEKDYEEYCAECKENGEKPMSFKDFADECEGDL